MSETFYRLHWEGSPELSADNAWSALWGRPRSKDGSQTECPVCDGEGKVGGYACDNCDGEGWEDCMQGYSCCDNAAELIAYFAKHGDPTADEPVAIFEGVRVGNGFDGEPLAIPTGQVRWTTYGALRAGTE